MRILHIDTGRELRGGQRQVLLLLRALRAAGHESLLLTPFNSPLWQQAILDGFSPLTLSLARVWRASHLVDLVHAHDARAHSLAAFAARVRFVVARRVAFPVSTSLISRWKYRRAARFLAVSNFVRQKLLSAGVPAAKIDVVYDGVEDSPARAAPWDAAYPVVALASMDPMKGRDLVSLAVEIAGVPVIYSSNLPEDLRRASVFLYISRSEGFGSAALLAMQLGVPVIASRIDGLTEVFEDGISGISVENEAPAIAAAIRALLTDPARAAALIENGRRRVAEAFTAAQLLAGTLACYRRTLAG